MSAQGLIHEFCERYELDNSHAEEGTLNLVFEEGLVISATPSVDDGFVNLTCLIETAEPANEPTLLRRVLEMQLMLWRKYGVVAIAAPSGGPLFLACDVKDEERTNFNTLSEALDRIVTAARELIGSLTSTESTALDTTGTAPPPRGQVAMPDTQLHQIRA